LSASEIVGAERCVNPAERDRELAMAAMLRDVLSRYVGVMPDELGFHRDARGRRTLSLSTLQFNASRAENMALIVVAPSGDVGVEVEQVRNDLPFDEMAAHFFEPEDEWNIRIAHAPALKASRFFDSWTGCEAFAQADSRVGSTPFLHRFCPADGFAAAVAVTDAEARPIFWNWR
jgi:4'-phosphopantetheinyl transferase